MRVETKKPKAAATAKTSPPLLHLWIQTWSIYSLARLYTVTTNINILQTNSYTSSRGRKVLLSFQTSCSLGWASRLSRQHLHTDFNFTDASARLFAGEGRSCKHGSPFSFCFFLSCHLTGCPWQLRFPEFRELATVVWIGALPETRTKCWGDKQGHAGVESDLTSLMQTPTVLPLITALFKHRLPGFTKQAMVFFASASNISPF